MKKALIPLLGIFSWALQAQVTLDPCIENHDFKIVVLGSSTAAGSGANPSDSAWVNRYRAALKTINPDNEVVNLAVGGYTTYKLMPNTFVTPSGRPTVDTLKNITAALKLNPDAIIVNLPSNDRQWPMSEQLSNFDSLYNHSWHSGVPLFVCTTQPIQPVNWATYQRAVRDSIINTYGSYAIEFFLPLADTNNAILPQFAADAVHLNNTGHGILFNQTWQADVLGKVFELAAVPDFAARTILLPESKCADSLMGIGVVVANLGDTAQAASLGWVKALGPTADSTLVTLNAQMLPCTVDTIWTTLNLGLQGNYDLSFTITHLSDTILDNNTTITSFETVEQPQLAVQADTLCRGQFTQFDANLTQGDTLFWYASMADTVPVYLSNGFIMNNDTSLFVQGVTGPLHYSDQLQTTNDWNINFNGNMFNLVAKRNLTLESFRIRSKQTGQIPVKVYTKSGAYQGFEQTPSVWNLALQDTLNVVTSGDSILLDIPDTSLNTGDTLAIYVHMANSGQQLLYRSGSSSVSYQTNELLFISGSGIGFNFGTDYPNRTINARFNYRFGENLLGSCATARKLVSHTVSPEMYLGPDTTGPLSGVWLHVPMGYTNPFWIELPTGDTISTMMSTLIDSTNLMPGMNDVEVVCAATDKFGCNSQDTIQVTLSSSFGIAEVEMNRVKLFPNPAGDVLVISASAAINRIEVIDLSGRVVLSQATNGRKEIALAVHQLCAGVFVARVFTEDGCYALRFIKR